MIDKISLIIPDGEDDRALIVVRSLAYSKKIKTYIVSSKYKSVHLSVHSRFFKLKDDTNNTRLERISELAKINNINVLLPIGQRGIQFVHNNYTYLNGLFNIPPIPALKEFEIVRNKWTLNEYCKANGFNSLKSFQIQDKESNSDDLSAFCGPVVLKPSEGEGGLGIRFFESGKHLSKELNENQFYLSNNYIVQEYIDGEVVSFTAFCDKGKILAHTIHHPAKSNNRTFVFAKIIELAEDDQVLKFAQKLLLKLSWNGMANMDLIKSRESNKLYLLDFNPRYFGTMLGTTASGVNYPYLACLKALGKSFNPPEFKKIVFGIYNGKEIFMWLNQRKQVDSIPFKYTNLSFVIKDPFPVLMQSLKSLINR